MSSVPVIKFLFRSEWKVLSEALKLNPIYECEAFGTASELSTFLSGNSAGMVVCSLRDKNDLIQLALLTKLIKRAAPNTLIKVIVVNFSGEKHFEKAVAKLGILDMVEDRIQIKALRFKIDFMMKAINAHQKKVANVPVANSVKTLDQSKAQDKKASENVPTWNPPLDNSNDVWLLKNETDCKKVLTRWLVKLMGPSPYVAQWTETKTVGLWKFEFKEEDNCFLEGKGAWFYKGDQKPDFVWAENIWLFTSPSFELYYQDETETVSRMSLKDKQLKITKNSEYAAFKESTIIETFNKEFAFKKDAQNKAGAESFEKENSSLKNLEGKGKTEALNGGPLSGKGKTEALSGGPLSGKGKTDALNGDPLSGKGKTSNTTSNPLTMDLEAGANDLSHDPLSQKSANDKKSSFWKGNNQYEQESAADLSKPTDQSPKTGAELSLENKNGVDKFLRNHNKAEEFEAKELGHAIKKDGVSDNLKGKTSSDEIEGHLTSPDARKAFAEKSAKGMSGKSSTDDLGGPLASPDSNKAFAEKSTKGMSGKSSTDDLGGPLSSPYANKAFAEKSAKDLSGKSTSDNLGGPLSSPDANKAFAEKSAKDLSGKSTSDNLGGPLSSPEKKASADKAAKDLSGKSASDNLGGPLSSPDANKAFAEKTAKDLSGKSTSDDLGGPLSSKETNKANAEKSSKELSGKSSTDNLGGPLASKDLKQPNAEKTSKESEEAKDQTSKKNASHKSQFISNDNFQDDEVEAAEVIDFQNAKREAAKKVERVNKEFEQSPADKEPTAQQIEDATQSAKVTSILIQNGLKVSCNLDDYFDQTIIFSTKQIGLASEKEVTLNLNFNYMNKDTNLKFIGNISQIDADDEGLNYVTVEISDENTKAFNSFIKLYGTRQENINLFFKTVKGY